MSSITHYKVELDRHEFSDIAKLITDKSGIHVASDQKSLIEHKLSKRLRHFNLSKFADYHDILVSNDEELQVMINAVTTNETYFFREEKHFEFLIKEILPKVKYDLFRCWSAAGSIGAEAYSIAMTVDSTLSTYQNWEVVQSDINDEVLMDGKEGVYPLKYSTKIPLKHLQEYCMQGEDENDGLFIIGDKLRKRVKQMHINLTKVLPRELGMFDVIFLRNMIIYFDDANKKIIVNNVLKHLKPGGYLLMGHSESLYNITSKVKQISPSIYQKPLDSKN